MDWGRRARPGGLEQRPGWRPRVQQTGDPGGRRKPNLSPWAPVVRAPKLRGPSWHRPVEWRLGGSWSGVRTPKARRPPGLGGHAWSGPGRGARAPRLAPALGAEARAEEARRPAEQRPQARGAGLRAQPHCRDSRPRPGPRPAAVAAAAVPAAAAATAAAVPGIAGPGPARGVGSAGPGARWGALSMRQRLGEGRGAALGAGSLVSSEPLPWPGASGRSVRSAGSLLSPRMGIDLGSLGWSERVLPPAAAEAGGRRGRAGKRREGKEGGEDDGGGGRARVPRAWAAGLALSQSLRTMLRPRVQRNILGPAPPSSSASAWVSAAAGGKDPREGGWGGGSCR